MTRAPLPHLVVIGGGFAGLWATRALARAHVRITLVDRRNHHLFQPLLYQVATAGLSAPDIAAPLRHILGNQRNVEVRLGEVTAIDKHARSITLADGSQLGYDMLMLCTGATHAYFGHDEWAADAPGLKTLDDAIALRRKLLLAFERAEAEPDPARKAAWLSFAVVGGGPPVWNWPARWPRSRATHCATSSVISTRPAPRSAWWRPVRACCPASPRCCR